MAKNQTGGYISHAKRTPKHHNMNRTKRRLANYRRNKRSKQRSIRSHYQSSRKAKWF